MNPPRVIHVVAADVSVLLTQSGGALPVLLHWGPRIHASDDDLVGYAGTPVRTGIDGDSDVPYEPSILPEHAFGWSGLPGLRLHRGGAGWSPRLLVTGVSVDGQEVQEGAVVQCGSALVAVEARDEEAGIEVVLEIALSPAGLLRARATVRNAASDILEVIGVDPSLRIPTEAREMLDFAGRWGTEKIPQRHPVVVGTHSRSSRRGRTGLDATTVVAVGTPGFDARSGRVWLCHVGIGGNHEHAVERTDAHLAFRGGELLLPGEVRLASGESYRSPWIFGSFGRGLDDAAARYHAFLRARSRSSLRPRPVTLNVWEAVSFDQDPATLRDLADRAAALGVERYVLDDGWFLGRSDDRAGLGDWTADPGRWPDGLAPLAEHVRGLGMEFGLWVEPEMINEDSELARAHPDWILRARVSELPARWRFQQVLDLTNPGAFTHILAALDTLIRDLGLACLKWDHNRDLIDAGHPASGAPAVHEQTLAAYRLMDELRARHPALEIESCASGGGRVDLGILERTDRVHTSDNHDPLDRARMLRWTGLLVPPEMLGSHVASEVSSVTGRTSDLHTRCATAFLGHFGVKWDLRELSERDSAVLGRWIAAYREHRELIATGRVVGDGDVDPQSPTLRGVVATDGSEALYTLMTPVLSADTRHRMRLPGLLPEARYRIEAARPDSLGPWWLSPRWLESTVPLGSAQDAPSYSGSLLREAGLDLLAFHPDRVVVLRLVRVA
ncbi:alpha-galactosidase [Rathayibacter rathayi]|uniref:alpha-galactosidase n=1 Tax=Rathayibacter rathayi TaxID=33887 RepID=UPI000CE85774|nr:alpha-galactosidase [Rathayibacter rathayi]PPG88749.1 alpha-galactosidase [Rathayibacter rathayi]PPG96920.1 alpha-galactosidase [Rathayibacter rathayi]